MSTIAVPRAPRAMLQQEENVMPSAVLGSKAAKFYARLSLYAALAKFKDDQTPRLRSQNDVREWCRDFLDSFAYLCDVEKGGGTVTAAALQVLPIEDIVLWLAANEGIRGHVELYANNILRKLANANSENRDIVENDILELALEKCHLRLEFYKKEMQRYATKCRKRMKHEVQLDSTRPLRISLKKFAEPPPSLKYRDFIQGCYFARSLEIKQIRQRSKNADDDYGKLAHYLGRLGATVSAVKAVVDATVNVPALRKISRIRPIVAPPSLQIKIDATSVSPYEIVRAICVDEGPKNPVLAHEALHAIVDHDLRADSKLRLDLRQTVTTRVHAELQIAGMFSKEKDMQFMADDRYIGCSKPACYFCYNWIREQKPSFILPATHNKIIPGCRGPESGVKASVKMDDKICGRLNQDILDYLGSSKLGHEHRRYQYQSTEGSSRASSRISTRVVFEIS